MTSEAARRSRLWLEAGIQLAADPTARIVCPACGLGVLEVADQPLRGGTHVERWMRCDRCGRAGTLLMERHDALKRAPTQLPADPKLDAFIEQAGKKILSDE